MVEGLAPPTRVVAHSQVTICRRLRIQYVFPHMCGVNLGPYSWIILVLRVAPSNKILRKFLEMWVFPLKIRENILVKKKVIQKAS